MEDFEKETLIRLAVLCNSKEISQEVFKEKTGVEFRLVWKHYNKECIAAWSVFIAGHKKKIREDRISDEVKKRVAIEKQKLATPKVIRQNVPAAIKHLAEIYVLISHGRVNKDAFLPAFARYFEPQIKTEKERIRKLTDNGWASIDWDAVEKHPLLSQLLSD